MNNQQLEKFLQQKVGDSLSGEQGHWQFVMDDIQIYCLTDTEHDRMRFIAGIAALDDLDSDDIITCLHANFDRALDARYCAFDQALWSAFIHPLSSLSETFADSGLTQVINLVKNFGDSYASGILVFATDYDEAGTLH